MSEDNGHYRAYAPVTLRPASLEKLGVVNKIIAEYEAKGFVMTLRQLYYQMVARGFIPNSDSEYNKLGNLVSEGRLQGLVSWTSIEDRGRTLKGLRTYERPEDAIKQALDGYRQDLWADQQWRPEVWVEKQALESVIASVCNRHRVDFFSLKGYASQSAAWAAGQRFASYIAKGQRPIVFHLGDHDPSGIDMTRDNRDRVSLFAGVPVIVQRLALNYDQIERFRPPPNPAKLSDSRVDDYIAMMESRGARDPRVSWELDALATDVIDGLIHDAVERIKDPEVWDESLLREVEAKRFMKELAGITDDEEE